MSNEKALIIVPQAQSIDYSDKRNYKLVDDVNLYQRGTDLLKMLHDVGAVVFDEANRFTLSSFFLNNKKLSPVGRLLGYAAEGIIVRDCEEDLDKNRKWLNFSRKLKAQSNQLLQVISSIFYEPFLENPNDFIAIGTGFASTRRGENRLIFNHMSDRDICWVHKKDNIKELSTVKDLTNTRQQHAGLQVKVSYRTNGEYVTNYFKSKDHYRLYPVVYFDLGDDFEKTKKKLLDVDSSKVEQYSIFSNNVNHGKLSRGDILDFMLIQGKKIAPELHEELLFYKSVFEKVVEWGNEIDKISNPEILTALIIEYVGKTLEIPSPVLVMPN